MLFAVFIAATAAPTQALAQERILSFDTDIQVHADGSLEVTEHITVRAEGSSIRRGIVREFPTRYRDRHGNRVVVGFELLQVLRNGEPEPWFTEDMSNGVRINTGNDDFLPVPATHAYTLKYRTTRQLGFFDDHDELYWNATGNDSIFVIDQASVDVRLPQPVPVAGLLAEAYTGPQGSRGQAYVATVPAPGTAHWDTTQPLPPGHGLTIVLSFPKGIVAEPDAAQRAQWFLRDNLGVLVGLAALALLLAFCIRRWRAIGRDPAPGVIIARYEAPAGHTPGGLRYIRKMGADQRAFSADLIELAVAGYLRIHREDGVLVDDWKLEQLRPPDDALLPSQRVILEQLFADGPMLELDNKQASTLQAARTLHAKAFGQRYQPAMFKLNGGSTGIAALIAVTGTVAAFVASGGAGIPLIIVLALAMLAVLIIFAILVRAHTPEGRRMLDEIEGLKLYLGVAEREELARLAGPGGDAPPLDADRYQRLLPYAVALEVEDAWTEQFTSVVGAEEAAAVAGNIAWYSGGRLASLSSLASNVGSALDSTISSASTPPGSSSGSGGGGFSGGGGGGGGVGGR